MTSPDQIKHAATAAGFDLAGVASVRDEDFPELAAFPEWIEAGHAGEMKYLEKRTETGELRRGAVKVDALCDRRAVVGAPCPHPGAPSCTAAHAAPRGRQFAQAQR